MNFRVNLGNITINDFVKALQTLSFDDVTEQTLSELLNKPVGVNNVEDYVKDIFIYDYVFTIVRSNEDETTYCRYRINDSILLSDYVEIWLQLDNGGDEIQAEGTIKQDRDKSFYIEIKFNIQ